MTEAVSRTEIEGAVTCPFRRAKTPTKHMNFDEELFAASCEKIKQLGYPLDDPATMEAAEPYLKLGPMITVGLYPHVTDQATRVFISVYAGLTTLIDDVFVDKPGPISEFNYRFAQGIPQQCPVLETFARLLHLFREHWSPVMADMLLQSSMTFITSITLEHAAKDAELSTCHNSLELARSFRDMSGIATLYCLWMFSPDTAPEMVMAGLSPIYWFINIADDVLLFYKDELERETSSYSSLCANNTSQLDAFKKMVNDAVDVYRDLEKLAEKYPSVYRPQLANLSGYFRYHLTLLGYRLIELLELDSEDIS